MTEIARDRYGRYLIVPEGGGKPVAHTRATTVAGTLDDTSNIAKWQQRHVAKGLTARPDLLALASSTPLSDRAALNDVCEQAIQASGGDAKANLGTAIHSLTESIDRGEAPEIPAAWQPDLDAYVAATHDAGIEFHDHLIEVILINRKLGEPIAGTADRIVTWKGDGFIFDIKTGSVGFPHKMAAQLAIYANADSLYIDGEHRPMPRVNRRWGIICHLPAGEGSCTLYLANLTAGWEAVQASVAARQWRKRKDLLKPAHEGMEAADSQAGAAA